MAPFVLVAGLTWVSTDLRVVGDLAPAWVAAEAGGHEFARGVSVSLTWEQAAPVVAPAWSGTVRQVLVGPGAVVRSGDEVVLIDAVVRLAWHSSAPFFRTLRAGSAGDDVAALNQMLAGLDLEHGDGDRFAEATRRGVDTLALRLGADQTGVFFPDWVVYLPTDEVHVATVETAVGPPAPGQGSPVLTLVPTAATARLDALAAEQQFADPGATAEAAPGESLVVGGTPIELAEDGRTLSPRGLAAVSGLVDPGTETVTGSLVRQVAVDSVEIPAAAVHTDASGVSCVAVRTTDSTGGRESTTRTVSVVVLAGTAGRVVVSGDLAAGDEVGVGAIAPGAPCG
jgi:hypothetical protein